MLLGRKYVLRNLIGSLSKFSLCSIAQTQWEVVIGLEVHAQLNVKYKLLSQTPKTKSQEDEIHNIEDNSSSYDKVKSDDFYKFEVSNKQYITATPNTSVGLCDAGLPGALPGINANAIKQVIKTGIAIEGNIQKYSRFDRKHYNYPDLPNSYQITQQFYPLVLGGKIRLFKEDYQAVIGEIESIEEYLQTHTNSVGERKKKRIEEQIAREKEKKVKLGLVNNNNIYQPEIVKGDEVREIEITRIHVEHDSGKSMHEQSEYSSLIDFNRSGIALMEIVTEPNIRSSLEAAVFVSKLQSILRHIESSHAEMDQGSLRCDVNISMRPYGSTTFGPRSEIKNLNSLKQIKMACDAEIRRQVEALETGTLLYQETRGFNPANQHTFTLRKKESEVDYRYFPDPDIPPLIIKEDLSKIKQEMPPLPDQLRELYVNQLNIPVTTAMTIINTPFTTSFFEKARVGRDPVLVANYIVSELFGLLFKDDKSIKNSPVTEEQIGSIVDLQTEGTISGKIGKKILKEMYDGKKQLAREISDSFGWSVVNDKNIISDYCQSVIDKFPDKISEYHQTEGEWVKPRIIKFLMGEIMKVSNGCLNPIITTNVLTELVQNTQNK